MDEQEYELKHWGILGMKWGVRNYQNDDGSLTPLGRIRYGVGPARGKTGNAMGVNDAGSLSDEELRRMTKRYKQQADYYRARNEYIQQENYFKQNTNPYKEKRPSKVGRFIGNVFGQPLENFMKNSVEFGIGALGYKLLENESPEMAAMYFKSLTGLDKGNSDPIKKASDEAYKMAQLYKNKNDLEKNKIEAEDIASGKYRKDKERERELNEMQFQNKYDKTKNAYEDNRYRESHPEEFVKSDYENGFKKVFDKNADEYVFSFWDSEEYNPKDKDSDGFNQKEFEFFKEAYPESGYRTPRKKK